MAALVLMAEIGEMQNLMTEGRANTTPIPGSRDPGHDFLRSDVGDDALASS